MDVKHLFTLVETFNRANDNAIGVLTGETGLGNDVSHGIESPGQGGLWQASKTGCPTRGRNISSYRQINTESYAIFSGKSSGSGRLAPARAYFGLLRQRATPKIKSRI
jgi:hypothetical protein